MGYLLKSSSTARPLLFLLIDSTDHLTGKTGLSPTVTISKNGAAFASPAGAVTEIANGWYKVAGNATDTNTTGPLLLHATSTGADPADDRFEVVNFDPDDAAGLGLSRLDAAVTSRMATFTLPTNFSAFAITAGGAVTVGTNNDKTGYTASTVSDKTGYSLAAGSIAAATFAAGAIDATAFAQGAADKVWSTATRALTDKAGFTLSAAYDPAKTAAQAGDAMALTSGERSTLAGALLDLAAGVETSLTLRQAMRLIVAAAAGKVSGAATTTITIRDTTDTKNRIVATCDASGNRSAITTDLT